MLVLVFVDDDVVDCLALRPSQYGSLMHPTFDRVGGVILSIEVAEAIIKGPQNFGGWASPWTLSFDALPDEAAPTSSAALVHRDQEGWSDISFALLGDRFCDYQTQTLRGETWHAL
eukprot:6325151-Amphidinium_carterae.4